MNPKSSNIQNPPKIIPIPPVKNKTNPQIRGSKTTNVNFQYGNNSMQPDFPNIKKTQGITEISPEDSSQPLINHDASAAPNLNSQSQKHAIIGIQPHSINIQIPHGVLQDNQLQINFGYPNIGAQGDSSTGKQEGS